ncbi:barstar family protein [Candidatus Nomurabacteria bacterium]|nr:barstar family protein [Candidatus Nomurabacteria bacterium]USN94575.1 MAG: barstar family protein [Candidatus Nomurabacteria bacterium]
MKIQFGKLEDIENYADTYIGIIPGGINSKKDLFRSYAEALRFPGYFGFNWDALDECLSDFHWIKDKKNILIYHVDIPDIDEKEKVILLSVLINNIFENSDGSLIVMFPEKYKERIKILLDKI